MDKSMTLEMFAHEVFGNSDRKGYLSQIENGKRSITPLTAKRLADQLDLADDIVLPMLSNGPATQEDVDVDALISEKNALEKQLLELSAKSGRTDNLREEGITEKAIIRLAQRVASDTDDVGQAWLELQSAMDVAVRVQADGRVTSNHGDFVDEVLKRVAALSAEGDYASAGEEIDAALSREEEESQARKGKLLERGVEVALLDRDTKRAAELLVRKADLDAGGRADFETLWAVGRFFYERGRDKGINLDLELAIDLAQFVHSRANGSTELGTALNGLGAALATIGGRESSTARLEQAVAAYEAALKEWTRDKVPLDWAITQNNLGTALRTLGERERGNARLEEAVEAHEDALKECTRDKMPLDWARTQNNLGDALQTLGQRESGTARLDQAAEAYEAALEEWTRDKVPLDWAMTQNNLSNVLTTLGQHESGTARLEEAVEACEAALEELTRDKVPLEWATTQNNLGNALQTLGQRESGIARLEAAVEAYEAALEERTRDIVPLEWAMTQNNLGTALTTLGERESGTARLEKAVEAYEAALKEWTRDRVPLNWAVTQHCLSGLELAYFDKTKEPAHLDQADAYAKAARNVYAEGGADHYVEWIDGRIAAIKSRREGI